MKKNANRKMIKYFKDVKGSIILLIMLTTLYCVISIINPIFNANLLTSITEFNVNNSIKIALCIVFLGLLKFVVNYISSVIYTRNVKQRMVLNIRRDMIKNVFDMQVANFDQHSSGEIINRITDDPQNVSNILSGFEFSFFNLVADIFALCYIFYLNYILGIVYVVSLIIIYIYEKASLNRAKKLSIKCKTMGDKTLGLLTEVVRGIRDIKVLNINDKVHRRLISELNQVTVIDGDKNIKYETSYNVVELFQSVTVFVIIFVGILLVKNDMLSITNLIVIYMYRINVYNISFGYRSIKSYMNDYSIACERIFEFMDDTLYPKESFGKKELSSVKGKIEFRDLSFAYNKKKVLNNVNLVIKPKEMIGIVGESGSGKTTLLNLLSKSYKVSKKHIFIDDVDINDLTKDSIRENIAVINQNPYIFNLTIKENLELVGDNITFSDIVEACKTAQIHDFIMSLPLKYDTLLGEGGTNLSGGQRQRLAIARALLKKSKIILFDEATSALDNVTQNELQKSINNISNDYTIIIVAHRLSTIKDCDRIYVMSNGSVVGSGSHDELLKNNENYKALYNQENI